jgi:hypothetical protein
MKDLTAYIESLIDEPQVKVKLVEGVYRVTFDLNSSKPTSIDTLAFKQLNVTERINNKLKTYLPSDVEYTVFVYVKPNLIISQRARATRLNISQRLTRMEWEIQQNT